MFGDRFPIGPYVSSVAQIQEAHAMGANVVLGCGGPKALRAAEECKRLGLAHIAPVTGCPDRLAASLDLLARLQLVGVPLAFYVNDEPAIHGFPASKTGDIDELLKSRFPKTTTCMAVVRPQVVGYYSSGADFFMMDQYPVPSMPMTWLSDSMDEASEQVGTERVMSIIQAFGGGRFREMGWPRMPTFREMDCLAFLSAVHGSRGIVFYHYRHATATAAGRDALTRVIGRLRKAERWLASCERLPVGVRILGYSGAVGADVKSPVHAVLKKAPNQDTWALIIVNTIDTDVRVGIELGSGVGVDAAWCDLFSERGYDMRHGRLTLNMRGYGVNVLIP